MKRILTFITIMLVAFALVIPAPAQAEFRDFWARVYTWDGTTNLDGKPNVTRLSSGVTYKVLATGSDTAETLYYYDNQANTSLTNPVTTSDFASDSISRDQIQFRTDPTDGSDDRVDLMVINTDGGGYVFYEDFNYIDDHTIIIDESAGRIHSGAIWFALVSSGAVATETSTGIDFRYDTVVLSVTVELVDVEAGSTMDVGLDSGGTNGDLNGFVAGMSTTTAGFPDNTLSTVGDLLDDGSHPDPFGHTVLSANEQTLTYKQLLGVAGTASVPAAGYIHYMYFRTR